MLVLQGYSSDEQLNRYYNGKVNYLAKKQGNKMENGIMNKMVNGIANEIAKIITYVVILSITILVLLYLLVCVGFRRIKCLDQPYPGCNHISKCHPAVRVLFHSSLDII